MSGDCTESPFWSWSIARYDEDGVAPRLLQLQDRLDFNVNMLLWCLWSAVQYEPVGDQVMNEAVDMTERWRRDVTGSLRTARRALKAPPREADELAAAKLRKTIRDGELEAERIEQAMLFKLADEKLSPDNGEIDHAARARRNLAAYAEATGAARREGYSVDLLNDLAARLFSPPAAGGTTAQS